MSIDNFTEKMMMKVGLKGSENVLVLEMLGAGSCGEDIPGSQRGIL